MTDINTTPGYLVSDEELETIRAGGEPAIDLFMKLANEHPADRFARGIYLVDKKEYSSTISKIGTIEEYNQLMDFVKKMEARIHVGHWGSNLQWIINNIKELERKVSRVIGNTQAFNDDLLTWLRAMVIVADSAGNAGTHAEKNARIRGMVDVIESAIESLRRKSFDYLESTWWPDDAFRSNYPVRHYMDRAHDAEARVKELEAELANANGSDE